ncbi:hypothetical protein [Bradyrhizobium sp. JYMT SZCCT0428]|uniref:hypothetical protein n=1 Tax=Bradyrhizobium sp. JYMT SZCCT0428 TaxID=2807673 RepID=UPI001BAE380E|nr:hypothetical protein [Bradyrhizobium sp. JYMT SZCCT0428]MBR1156117.1 hypothetical protein [Bradyrhizobium sp. JYMT SZCCT0428]
MNILFLYNSTQTYTSTVFEHVGSFAKYSKYAAFFCHLDQTTNFNVDLSRFAVVAIHYSVRLPFDQISESFADALTRYKGLKVLFIQDEYDYTFRAWHWISRLGVRLVFTAVPVDSIVKIYPPGKFPGVRFVNNLTGYVPEHLRLSTNSPPASKRDTIFGYRGRPLPIRYGALAIEKVLVGKLVKDFCEVTNIKSDIAWSESERIYGDKWYEFLTSCRAILGSESGSNVFDWDNSLTDKIEAFKRDNPSATNDEIYSKIVEPVELPGLMNQISPRVFETIAAGAVLVLFEGNYSGLLKPWEHFIPLKKDGSNLAEVWRLLQDGAYVDELTRRAVQDIIAPKNYDYRSYVTMVDSQLSLEIDRSAAISVDTEKNLAQYSSKTVGPDCSSANAHKSDQADVFVSTCITTSPTQYKLPDQTFSFLGRPIDTRSPLLAIRSVIIIVLLSVWNRLPQFVRRTLKPMLQELRGRPQ